MTQKEMESLKAGDLVTKRDETLPFTVLSNRGETVVVMQHATITDLGEWIIMKFNPRMFTHRLLGEKVKSRADGRHFRITSVHGTFAMAVRTVEIQDPKDWTLVNKDKIFLIDPETLIRATTKKKI